VCGRYQRRSNKQKIAEAFHLGNVDGLSVEFAPDYNAAPQSMQPVIDGQGSPPSCWRLFSLSSAGWDGRNDRAADGCYSDGAALLFFWLSARSRKRTGIPAGEVVYQNIAGQPFAARDLRSPKLGISGKPDCLIRTADGIVPVELKKLKRPPARDEVYPNHMIQNLAYCALVEEQLRERVPYGLVKYAGQQVRRVKFTNSNRRWLMHTIAALQAARLREHAKRNHNRRCRCSGCGVRDKCDQVLR
jgi:CRISPR-associated exonuclease Cas4